VGGGSGANFEKASLYQEVPDTTSYELHAILLQEDRRRKEEPDDEDDDEKGAA